MAEMLREYEFEKFGGLEGSAARVITQPDIEVPEKKPDVVKIPKKILEKSRRPQIKPLRTIFHAAVFAAVIIAAFVLIFNYVALTELTEEISQESYTLEKAQAFEVELTMKIAEKINAADIEAYAKDDLGMVKIHEGQVRYVNMVQEDSGKVLQEENKNIFQKIWDGITGFFG